MPRLRLGIFGGTFDPPHLGHLVAARDVLEAHALDRVLLIPARRSPHKPDQPLTDAMLRLRMLKRAVKGDPHLEASDVEVRRAGLSYTADTVAELATSHPDTDLYLILGADQWSVFHRWSRPREIARRAELVVMTRGGEHPGESAPGFDDGPPPGFLETPVTRLDISATDLRKRVDEGRSLRYLVPDPVLRIIEDEKLYL